MLKISILFVPRPNIETHRYFHDLQLLFMSKLHSIWGSGLGFLCAIWRLVGPEEAAEMLKIFKVKIFLCHSCFSWSNVSLEPHIPTISFSTTSTSLNSLVEGARGVSSPWDDTGLRYGQTQPWAPLPSPTPLWHPLVLSGAWRVLAAAVTCRRLEGRVLLLFHRERAWHFPGRRERGEKSGLAKLNVSQHYPE